MTRLSEDRGAVVALVWLGVSNDRLPQDSLCRLEIGRNVNSLGRDQREHTQNPNEACAAAASDRQLMEPGQQLHGRNM
jgi:hypothetical protein